MIVLFNGPGSKWLAKCSLLTLTFDFWCPVLLFSRQKEEMTCVVAGVADHMDTHISWLALQKRKKLSLLYSRNIIFSRPRKQKSPQPAYSLIGFWVNKLGWCWFVVKEKYCWLTDKSWLKPSNDERQTMRDKSIEVAFFLSV